MALAVDNRPYGYFAFPPSQGVSDDAGTIRKNIEDILATLHGIVATKNPRRETLEALDQSVAECLLENWDGYGARPVDPSSYYYACLFIDCLLPSLQVPDVGVDPDGEISFEWFRGPRQVFSISIAPNGDLSYAGMFGRNKVHGVESFEDRMPGVIVNGLKRLSRVLRLGLASMISPRFDSEKLTRFLKHKDHFSRLNQRVKGCAFMPDPYDVLSVFLIDDLDDAEIWHLLQDKLYGRADLFSSVVTDMKLRVEPDAAPPRHANLVGWPSEKHERKMLAQQLAAEAMLRLRPENC